MLGPKAIRVKSEGRKFRRGAETDHHGDEIVHGDLPAANGDRSLRRGKTGASAGGARNGAGTRTAKALAERIREERDNNLYRRELDGAEDKDRQDRRSLQRDVEEEADDGSRSSVAARRSRDAEDTEDAEKNGAFERLRGGGPYRQRGAKERGARLADNGVRQIGRFDRAEEENAAKISARKNSAKRHETPWDGNGDRHEQPNLPTGDRREVKEDRGRLEEATPSESKKATGCAEEGKLVAGNDPT